MANEFFSLLKQDHTEARHLMEKILGAPQDQWHGLLIDLTDTVQLHMQLEERYFYPRLEGHKVLKPAQQDALREHKEARDLLHQLDRMDVRDREWVNQFRLLQQGLLNHMQIEEGYVFEKAADIFSAQEFQELARKAREQKQSAQRQHQTGQEHEIRA
jgi:hemerythrin-like domain-containing protein